MRSMTGFGSGEAPLGNGKVRIELRSLNHRFLEVRVKAPPELSESVFFLEQSCRKQLTRGRYDVLVRLEGAALPPPELDMDRARAVYQNLCALRDELTPNTELPVTVLAQVPDLFTGRSHIDYGPVQVALANSLAQAIKTLDEMRTTEGRTLQGELLSRLNTARSLREQIALKGPEIVEATHRRLRERLDRLTGDHGVPVDENRLEAEVAVLADRSDITEELVRLNSHFDQFESLLDSSEPVGRRFDFLLQEIGREANTVGAKCQDASLAQAVVGLKSGLERLREQVQNVE